MAVLTAGAAEIIMHKLKKYKKHIQNVPCNTKRNWVLLVLKYICHFIIFAHEHNSPTGVLTEGDDLEGLFLPDELDSDDGSTALLSDCKRKKLKEALQPVQESYDKTMGNCKLTSLLSQIKQGKCCSIWKLFFSQTH